MMVNKLIETIDSYKNDLSGISDRIFDNPEIGMEEVEACRLLCDYLESNGFEVDREVGDIPTSFRAVYESGKGGPSFGLLCEYDALENLGHACGHHMQGPSIAGTAIALKENVKDRNFKIVVYGTPAEETVSGKVKMLKNGCFKDIDIALMMHGDPNTTTDVKSMAVKKIKVNFHGKSAHSAIKPEHGRSAFDALLLAFHGIEFLREHVRDDVRMHYTVLDAGGPANIVPERSVGSFYIRSYENNYLEDVMERFEDIIKGAALMTGTDYEIVVEKELKGKIPVLKLNDLLMKNARILKAPSISPPREKTGSTDFGDVMTEVPGSCIRVSFVPEGTSSHSEEYLKAGKTEKAHDAILYGSKILAISIYDMIIDNSIIDDIKDEFNSRKKDRCL